MKQFLTYALLSLAASAPALSFAQSTAPVTRAQVVAELTQLENAGYRPTANNSAYPADIEAAETKVSADQLMASQAVTTQSEGGVTSTHSASGSRGEGTCVGPVSFCTVYFGR